jgi:hypothetical protein
MLVAPVDPVSRCINPLDDAQPRRKIIPRRRQRTRHARVARKDQSLGRAGEDLRLLALHQRLQLVVLFQPGPYAIPTRAVVDRQPAGRFPTILREKRKIQVAIVKALRLALRIT